MILCQDSVQRLMGSEKLNLRKESTIRMNIISLVNETVKRMKELAKLARAVGNTTATEDREEPVVEEENEGPRTYY